LVALGVRQPEGKILADRPEHLVDGVRTATAALDKVDGRRGRDRPGRRRGRRGAGSVRRRHQTLCEQVLERGHGVGKPGHPTQFRGRAMAIDQDQQSPLADVEAGLALPDFLLAGRCLRVDGLVVHGPPGHTVPFATNLMGRSAVVQRVRGFPFGSRTGIIPARLIPPLPDRLSPAPALFCNPTEAKPVTQTAILVLEDGTVFEGVSVGAPGLSVGEVVFNTAMTGYQEVLTDPSYARQLVTLTYPHIGNTGCTDQDDEAARAWAAGLIVRDVPRRPSSWRAQAALPDWL